MDHMTACPRTARTSATAARRNAASRVGWGRPSWSPKPFPLSTPLDRQLGHLDSYQDFAFLMDHMTASMPQDSARTSGYSR